MNGDLNRRRFFELSRSWKEIKLQVLMVFSLAFFHHCWGVMERDVLTVFDEFYLYNKFEKSLNATFLALVLKKNDASNIQDFRPISLVVWWEVFIRFWPRCWQTA